jgi:hypothetical protein
MKKPFSPTRSLQITLDDRLTQKRQLPVYPALISDSRSRIAHLILSTALYQAYAGFSGTRWTGYLSGDGTVSSVEVADASES